MVQRTNKYAENKPPIYFGEMGEIKNADFWGSF